MYFSLSVVNVPLPEVFVVHCHVQSWSVCRVLCFVFTLRQDSRVPGLYNLYFLLTSVAVHSVLKRGVLYVP